MKMVKYISKTIQALISVHSNISSYTLSKYITLVFWLLSITTGPVLIIMKPDAYISSFKKKKNIYIYIYITRYILTFQVESVITNYGLNILQSKCKKIFKM